jgi:hypothetical protein
VSVAVTSNSVPAFCTGIVTVNVLSSAAVVLPSSVPFDFTSTLEPASALPVTDVSLSVISFTCKNYLLLCCQNNTFIFQKASFSLLN